MKLKDLPTAALRRAALATEKVAGPDSQAAKILRRELDRRKQPRARRRGAMPCESMKNPDSNVGAAGFNPTCNTGATFDPDLEAVIRAWPDLSPAQRAAVAAVARASAGSKGGGAR